jgi:hypothetical protein
MRRTLMAGLGLAAASGALACGDEAPTEIGATLLGDGYQTYEVVLDAAEFLASDTTYDRLGRLNLATFALVANDYEGELDAHTLFKLTLPGNVTYDNADGASVTDSVFRIVGGELTVVVDSLADATPPVTLEVLQVEEEWHWPTVTWDLRADSTGPVQPWTIPGGADGPVLGSNAWQGADTVRIPLDSAAAAVWQDSAALDHGGLLRMGTPGSRLRIVSLEFLFDVVPASTDTVIEVGSISVPTIVASPEPSTPTPSESRVGGIPAWRTALQFRPLAELEVPCGPQSTGCTLPLSEADVNLAVLLLQPVPVGARRIERPMQLENRMILQGPGAPLTRSPLGTAIGGMTDSLYAADFTATPPDPSEARIFVTQFVRSAIAPRDEDDEAPILWLALTARNEGSFPVFGYGAFGSLESAVPPRLQLLVTAPTRVTP